MSTGFVVRPGDPIPSVADARTERAQLVEEIRELIDRADGRVLTDDERREYELLHLQIDYLASLMALLQRHA